MKTLIRNGRPNPSKLASAKPRLELLEDRLALSGFGPDDGSYIIEPWTGSYNAVQIQATDEKIVAAGPTSAGSAPTVERYDSLGNVDTAYGTGGLATIAAPAGNGNGGTWGLTLQDDGKAVLVGGVSSNATGTDIRIARLTARGTLDSTFGSGGQTVVSTYPLSGGATENLTAVALQSSGKIVAAGDSGGVGLVGRFTASGALDTGKSGFGDVKQGKGIGYHRATELNLAPNAAGSTFNAEVVQADDKVVVAGERWNYANGTYTTTLAVMRYTAAGAIDSTFNGNGKWSELQPPGTVNSRAYAVALQTNGKIVVAGADKRTDTGAWEPLVARFNADGSLDTTFGSGTGYVELAIGDGIAMAQGVAVQPDQRIVIAGIASTGGMAARLNPDGTLDSTFGGVGYKISVPPSNHGFAGNGIALQADGSIIVAGVDNDSTSGKNVQHPLLIRFSGDSAIATASGSSATTASPTTTDAALMLLLTDTSTTTTTKRK